MVDKKIGSRDLFAEMRYDFTPNFNVFSIVGFDQPNYASILRNAVSLTSHSSPFAFEWTMSWNVANADIFFELAKCQISMNDILKFCTFSWAKIIFHQVTGY